MAATEEIIEPKLTDMDGVAIIEEVKIEEEQNLFDLSEVEVMPLPDVIEAGFLGEDVLPTIVPQLGKEENSGGMGVGGFFAIVIFVSILIYIFRKCQELSQNRIYNKPSMKDSLASLL